MGKKFVFYLKDSQKAITITDLDETRPIGELKKIMASLISSADLCHFSTEKDCLVLKPDRIVGVWIEDIGKGKGRGKEETLNLDDLDLDIPIPDIPNPPKEETASKIPPELVKHDLDITEGMDDFLESIDREENEIEQALMSTEDASPYNPNVPTIDVQPTIPTRKNIPQESPQIAKSRIPEHFLPEIESSEDAGGAGMGSELLNTMGVHQQDPSGSSVPEGAVDPSNVPMVGQSQIVSGQDIAKNIIKAASANKKIVSVTPVRITR